MGSEVAEFWKRDPLSVIRGILLDRTLGRHMQWAPERHYTCRARKQRRRDELWTADWMWRVQVSQLCEHNKHSLTKRRKQSKMNMPH